MKNLILQHFNGELRELDLLSINNIQNYAKQIGVDYELIRGKPFDPRLTDPCQKVQMLSKEFDDYNEVVMLDIDMFAVNGLVENIFNYTGNGLYEAVQKKLHLRINKQFPKWTSMSVPYWGGAIYKFNKNEREYLRKNLNSLDDWVFNYNKPYFFEDEGIMHTLAFLSKEFKYGPSSFIDPRWCQGSFFPNPDKAFIIHIRTKIFPEGPKKPKLENYNMLKNKGIIK